MNAEWRTSTVTALCHVMLDKRDFAALPILADALEDAGCTDREILDGCRGGKLSSIMNERLVNIVFSEETEKAAEYMEEMASELFDDYEAERSAHTLNYEGMIKLGHDILDESGAFFGADSPTDFFRQDYNRVEFFRNWSLLTGVRVAASTIDVLEFRCAC